MDHGIDAARRTSIATALREYTEIVSQHNLTMLRILVDGMASQEDETIIDEEVDYMRLLPFRQEYLEGDLPDSVEIVQDLLTDPVLAELTTRFSLNGVRNGVVDTNARDTWFSNMRRSIEQKAPSVTDFPPAELRYVCTLVNGIIGTGLPYFRGTEQIQFISDLKEEVDDVLTYDELSAFEPLWEDWEIAIACKLGAGLRSLSGGLTLFCRKPSAGLDWQWRYGLYDEGWCSEMYNSIEDFLAWYAHHNEQTAEQVRKVIRPLDPTAF